MLAVMQCPSSQPNIVPLRGAHLPPLDGSNGIAATANFPLFKKMAAAWSTIRLFLSVIEKTRVIHFFNDHPFLS